MTAAARFAPLSIDAMLSPIWRGLSLAPFAPRAALRVIEDLDALDRVEIQLGGIDPTPDEILRQFVIQSAGGAHFQIAYAHAPEGGATPFAIIGVAEALAVGTGSVALIARDHRAWARPLRRLAAGLRADLPTAMCRSGLRRLEARCWSAHPTAPRLLRAIGFAFETELRGFALSSAPWLQFSLTPNEGA